MKATVLVRPKEGILDPQGEAVLGALRHLDFAVDEVRIGRVVDIEPRGEGRRRRTHGGGRMREQLLANPLIESFEIELHEIAVVTFPGSNDDRDAVAALESLGGEAILVWHADERLPDVGAVVLPGGFSYGDYLRCGAIARFAPVMRAVKAFADEGGLVLGICNGFQVLCEAGLLPGACAPTRRSRSSAATSGW